MRDFSGKPWTPPVKRRALGGPMPYSEARGLGGPTPYQNAAPEEVGLPVGPAKRKGLSPDVIKALSAGALGGMAGKPGMTAALAMQGMDFIKKMIAQRKAAALQGGGGQQANLNGLNDIGMKGGGKVKGRTENTQRPNKQVPAPAPVKKKANGGKLKGC